MSFLAIVVLAFSMSADAFAAALGKGAILRRPSVGEALRAGAIFGTIEAITPLIGWAAGSAQAPISPSSITGSRSAFSASSVRR
jgi:manganese efflux pump family protein